MMASHSDLQSTLHQWMALVMRRSMREMVLRSRELGLSMAQLGALFHIHRKHVCSVSDIGDDMGTSRAAASQMLNRLVKMGYVERTEDPDDRRAKRIIISDKGLAMLRKSLHARLSWVDDVAQALTPEERQRVDEALKLLIARAYQMDPHPHPIMPFQEDLHWHGDPRAHGPEMTRRGRPDVDHNPDSDFELESVGDN